MCLVADTNHCVLSTYAPAIVFVLLGTVIGVAFTWLNYVIGPTRDIEHKLDPYESGMPSEIKQGFRFGISFYLVAMLFLLFDIEVAFLYPWAMALRQLGWPGFVQVVLFMALMLAGYVYVWRKGVLDWGSEPASATDARETRKVA